MPCAHPGALDESPDSHRHASLFSQIDCLHERGPGPDAPFSLTSPSFPFRPPQPACDARCEVSTRLRSLSRPGHCPAIVFAPLCACNFRPCLRCTLVPSLPFVGKLRPAVQNKSGLQPASAQWLLQASARDVTLHELRPNPKQ